MIMTQLFAYLTTVLRREEGATAVEYGIMVAAIAAVIIAIVFLIGDQVLAAFDTVLQELVAN